jgi:hypothetical protein
MGMAAVSERGIIAMRCKAVLKHTQSKRWREVWCGPASAKRLDCVRFIAALSHSFLTRSAAKILHDCPPASEFGIKTPMRFCLAAANPGRVALAGTLVIRRRRNG